MSFHVCLSASGWTQANRFNLSEAEVVEDFVEPWELGSPIVLDGKVFEPTESTIQIREGPIRDDATRNPEAAWVFVHNNYDVVTDKFITVPPASKSPVAKGVRSNSSPNGFDHPLRVFVSHTGELAEHPTDRTFVAAARAAIERAGHVVVEMSTWTASEGPSARTCVDKVSSCDVYIALIGFRYGSPVRDRPQVSYTELEYETAKGRGLPVRLFLLSETAPLPRSVVVDGEFGERQERFREMLATGNTYARFASPGDVEVLLYQALIELAPAPRKVAEKWPTAQVDKPDERRAYPGSYPLIFASPLAEVPIVAGKSCDGIAISPDGATAYLTNLIGRTVTPIDLTTRQTGVPIRVSNYPNVIAITPDGATAYVTSYTHGMVMPINLQTHQPRTPIPVSRGPGDIAITPDGATAYVTSYRDGTLTPIDLETHQTGPPILAGKKPEMIAITPDGATAYVTNFRGNTVTPIDLFTRQPGAPIPCKSPNGIAITPDGATAYVTNNTRSSTVTPIDLATHEPRTAIPIGRSPTDIVITPDGATAFVGTSWDTTVTSIDLATCQTGTPISVGKAEDNFSADPVRIAITPDGATAYVAVQKDGLVTLIHLR